MDLRKKTAKGDITQCVAWTRGRRSVKPTNLQALGLWGSWGDPLPGLSHRLGQPEGGGTPQSRDGDGGEGTWSLSRCRRRSGVCPLFVFSLFVYCPPTALPDSPPDLRGIHPWMAREKKTERSDAGRTVDKKGRRDFGEREAGTRMEWAWKVSVTGRLPRLRAAAAAAAAAARHQAQVHRSTGTAEPAEQYPRRGGVA